MNVFQKVRDVNDGFKSVLIQNGGWSLFQNKKEDVCNNRDLIFYRIQNSGDRSQYKRITYAGAVLQTASKRLQITFNLQILLYL